MAATSTTADDPLGKLQEEIALLNGKLHHLSVEHYRQVVDARESLSRSAAVGADLESKVEQTVDALPDLRARLLGFQERGKRVVQEHKRTLSTIDLHAQLVDLLQLPQLMDTCARSGAVDESLELCSFARTLRTRHDAIEESIAATRKERGTGASIIRAIADEVEESASALRRQLLQQLRGPVDLPTCLRLLSHLKRLDAQRRTAATASSSLYAKQLQPHNSLRAVADEMTLRREFLEARDAFLQMQTLATVERGDPPYQSTLKVIQKNREIWFDVITQYQAIFGSADRESSETLARWIGAKVRQFVAKLRESIARFENCGELGTVFELSSSFAASLARVGADFRPLLPTLFMTRSRELMNAQWVPAATTFRAACSAGDWGEAAAAPTPSSSGVVSTREGSMASKEDDLAPPTVLLGFPAAVDLVNTFLRSFNDLRSFACVNCVRDLASDLLRALEIPVEGLQAFAATNANAAAAQSLPQQQQQQQQRMHRFQQLLDLYANRVLPYLAKCFAVVFDWKSVAQLVDVSRIGDQVRLLMRRGPGSAVHASSSPEPEPEPEPVDGAAVPPPPPPPATAAATVPANGPSSPLVEPTQGSEPTPGMETAAQDTE